MAIATSTPCDVRDLNLAEAGKRRIEAFKTLGRDEVLAHIIDIDSIVRGEFVENALRKDLTLSERVAIAASMTEALGERRGRPSNENVDERPQLHGEKTRDIVARKAGFGSGKTLDRAKAIVGAALREPEKFGKLKDDMDRTGRVNGLYKRLVIARQAEVIRKEPPPLPAGPFRVIVADPPWPYEVRTLDPSHRVTQPYPPMSISQICALDVAGIAHDDCILWLWTTNHHMREAFAVLDAWGFTQKTILTWGKSKMSTGDWLRGKTEHCLMAVRGRPVVTLSNQTTLLHGPVRAHSQKPDEFYAMVESLCPAPDGGRLEMFQREPRPGWIGHGDEAGNTSLPSTEAAA